MLKLEVWKLSDDFAYRFYQANRKFSKLKMYGITSQDRRVVLSVSTNIVERYSRLGDKVPAYFISISLDSLAKKYLLVFFKYD